MMWRESSNSVCVPLHSCLWPLQGHYAGANFHAAKKSLARMWGRSHGTVHYGCSLVSELYFAMMSSDTIVRAQAFLSPCCLILLCVVLDDMVAKRSESCLQYDFHSYYLWWSYTKGELWLPVFLVRCTKEVGRSVSSFWAIAVWVRFPLLSGRQEQHRSCLYWKFRSS